MNLNEFFLPIADSSDCNIEEAVYILKCKKCNIFYIGETNKFKCRFSAHLFKIRGFKPYIDCTPVSIHFNLKEHNFLTDLEFYIFKTKNIKEKYQRLNKENHLIQLFLKVNVKILNNYIPDNYALKNNNIS